MSLAVHPETGAKVGLLKRIVSGGTEHRQEVILVPISDLHPSPFQARRKFDPAKLRELAATIKADGIDQPISARQREDGSYEIIFGERRWQAAKIAGLTKVPVLLRNVDDRTAKVKGLLENLQRENLCLSDEADAIAALVKESGSARAVANILGKDDQHVSRLVRLSGAPKEIRALMDSGLSGDADGLLELTRCWERDEAAGRAILKQFELEGGRTSLRKLVRENSPASSPPTKGSVNDRAKERPEEKPTRDPVTLARGSRQPVLITQVVSARRGVIRVRTSAGPVDLAFETPAALIALGKALSKLPRTFPRKRL